MKMILKFGALLPALLLWLVPPALPAQIGVGIGVSIHTPPPPLPVYVQPPCPVENYLWTPGYWAWSADGYYWVPGDWVPAPESGLLWTPGYWAFENGGYLWNEGYWGSEVGFYGGVDYGFGYLGVGFVGGMWAGNVFRYNTAVMHVDTAVVHNVYVDRNVTRNETSRRASFNGPGGVTRRPTAHEEAAMHARHIPPTTAQTERRTTASRDPSERYAANHGHPAHPALTRASAHPAAEPGRADHDRRASNRAAARPEDKRTARPETARRSTVTHPTTETRAAARHESTSRPATAERPETRPATTAHRETAPRTEAAGREATRPITTAHRETTSRTAETSRREAPRETHAMSGHTETPRPETHTTARATAPERPEASRPTRAPGAESHPAPTPRAESKPAPTPHMESHSAPAARSESKPAPESRSAPEPAARRASHPPAAKPKEEKPH
jgi:hypothetical protein